MYAKTFILSTKSRKPITSFVEYFSTLFNVFALKILFSNSHLNFGKHNFQAFVSLFGYTFQPNTPKMAGKKERCLMPFINWSENLVLQLLMGWFHGC